MTPRGSVVYKTKQEHKQTKINNNGGTKVKNDNKKEYADEILDLLKTKELTPEDVSKVLSCAYNENKSKLTKKTKSSK